MLRFLRLFPQFVALERECRELSRTSAQSEGEVIVWRDRCLKAEARLVEMTDKFLDDKDRVADALSLRLIGRRIHGKATDMPAPDAQPREPISLGSGRMLARAAVQRDTYQFFQDLMKASGAKQNGEQSEQQSAS